MGLETKLASMSINDLKNFKNNQRNRFWTVGILTYLGALPALGGITGGISFGGLGYLCDLILTQGSQPNDTVSGCGAVFGGLGGYATTLVICSVYTIKKAYNWVKTNNEIIRLLEGKALAYDILETKKST